jgi:hypothetical protein
LAARPVEPLLAFLCCSVPLCETVLSAPSGTSNGSGYAAMESAVKGLRYLLIPDGT